MNGHFQAVGKDNIYPGVNFFEKGYNANNDPFRGYILIFVASMGFVMLADLNAIGMLASNFFLASYALMNLSCFHSDFTKSPRLGVFKLGQYNIFLLLVGDQPSSITTSGSAFCRPSSVSASCSACPGSTPPPQLFVR